MNSGYITISYKYTSLTRRLACLAWTGLMLSLTGLFIGLHHSTRREEAQNYGTDIALWDHVFGTFIPAQGTRQPVTGN